MIFAFGIVILLVAFLNFSNFAVAAVPFKLRETNIKKYWAAPMDNSGQLCLVN